MVDNQLKFLMEIGKLKDVERQGWVIRGIEKPERVAGHMYRMAIMAMMMRPVPGLNKERVIQLALVHDMAECVVGDLTPHDGVPVDEKHRREREAMNYLTDLLPNESGSDFSNLYLEYEKQETLEAHTTKDFDLFDMVLQAFEYEKREFAVKGKIPDLKEFYDETRILKKIRNEDTKSMLRELLQQRSAFLALNAAVIVPVIGVNGFDAKIEEDQKAVGS